MATDSTEKVTIGFFGGGLSLRLPYRQRLTLIINELGVGLGCGFRGARSLFFGGHLVERGEIGQTRAQRLGEAPHGVELTGHGLQLGVVAQGHDRSHGPPP